MRFLYDQIPDTVLFPEDVYRMKVTAIRDDGRTKEGNRLMFTVEERAVEGATTGAASAGLMRFENYTFGTEEDPDALDPQTQKISMGFRMWKRFVAACGITLDPNEDSSVICQKLLGREFLRGLTVVKNDGKRSPERKGQDEQKSTGIWSIGDPAATRGLKRPAPARAGNSQAGAARMAAAPAPAPAPPPPAQDLGGGFSFEEE